MLPLPNYGSLLSCCQSHVIVNSTNMFVCLQDFAKMKRVTSLAVVNTVTQHPRYLGNNLLNDDLPSSFRFSVSQVRVLYLAFVMAPHIQSMHELD